MQGLRYFEARINLGVIRNPKTNLSKLFDLHFFIWHFRSFTNIFDEVQGTKVDCLPHFRVIFGDILRLNLILEGRFRVDTKFPSASLGIVIFSRNL